MKKQKKNGTKVKKIIKESQNGDTLGPVELQNSNPTFRVKKICAKQFINSH